MNNRQLKIVIGLSFILLVTLGASAQGSKNLPLCEINLYNTGKRKTTKKEKKNKSVEVVTEGNSEKTKKPESNDEDL
jgi:hypothetical protein